MTASDAEWLPARHKGSHPGGGHYYMCFTKDCKSYRESIRKAQIEGDFGKLMQEVAPSTAVLSVTRRMFTDIWDARLAQAKDHAALYKRKAAEIDKQVDGLLTRLVDATEPRVSAPMRQRSPGLRKRSWFLKRKPLDQGNRSAPSHRCSNSRCSFSQTPGNSGKPNGSTCNDWC